MNNVILKSAIVGIISVIIGALLVFAGWILLSPQTMATACENTGNYSLAITCADLRYKYSKDVYDLARCAQDSIFLQKDKLIVKYCEQLVENVQFDEVCKTQDEYMSKTEYGEYATDYKKYIYSKLAMAQYRTGNLEGAMDSAKKGENFSTLVIEIMASKDVQAASIVIETLEDYDKTLYKILNDFLQST